MKTLKDIQCLEDFDYNTLEVIRGETPPDIENQCLKLCKNYLSGNWEQQTTDTILLQRVTGGWVNQLYKCSIKCIDDTEKVPQIVAIKFYGENQLAPVETTRLRDVIVALHFSMNNLGPKIYGLFEEGQIQQFYEHRLFGRNEFKNNRIVAKVMQTLAQIHAMDVPISKDPNTLYEVMVRGYEEALQKLAIDEECNKFNCETIKSCDLRTEFDWIKKAIERADSPVILCHNDFRSGNLLITETNEELVVCDFDDSGYGYRGYDFVALFKEWGQRSSRFEPIDCFPFDDSEVIPLLESYVEECQRIRGKCFSQNKQNSIEHILTEVKVFTVFTYLFKVIHVMKNDQNNNGFDLNRKVCMSIADVSLKNYLVLKSILIEQGILD